MDTVGTGHLAHHASDFSVRAPLSTLENRYPGLQATRLGPDLSRVIASVESIEELMKQVRAGGLVAHHIYVDKEVPQQEVVISDTIEFSPSTGTDTTALIARHHLDEIRRVGGRVVARVTTATGMNPIKVANLLRAAGHEAEVQATTMLKAHDSGRSWHVAPVVPDEPDAGFAAAWAITRGSPSIVVAVIDDGFDLQHPCFSGVKVSERLWNFAGNNDNVYPQRKRLSRDGKEPGGYHGTSVASLIFGVEGSRVRGVAPGCTFLPIKLPVGQEIGQELLVNAFEYASAHAHVVCCSLGHDPSIFKYAQLSQTTVDTLTQLTQEGGVDRRGISIVCSAGNEGLSVLLPAADNLYGVEFRAGNTVQSIPRNRSVYTSFPTIDGIISVGSVTSGGVRAAYSNLGPISLVAPSNNFHELQKLVPLYQQQRYPGRHLIAAQNRPGLGGHMSHGLVDAAGKLDRLYTWFGGTSGAAPLVAGTIGLMKSIRVDRGRPPLTSTEVLSLLQSSCIDGLVSAPTFDDPNLQGTIGTFSGRRSPWYGNGLLQAATAVHLAK